MMKLYLTFILALLVNLSFGQNALVQVIHNSPIPGSGGGPTVDIYLNGNSDMANPDIPDLAFRTATPFVELPAGATQIHIVADGGDPATDTVFYAEANLMAGESYIVVAYGEAGSDSRPFGLAIQAGARQMSGGANLNDLLVFHGSPDAPAVSVDAKDVANLLDSLAYGSFGGYATVPNDDYIVNIRPEADTTSIVARYQAPLATLNAGGAALTVFASGYLSNSPAFGLYATLPDGTTLALPDTSIASLQVIHNSPFSDQMGGPAVDIFVNGQAPADGPLKNVPFRAATPFLEVPGDVALTFDVVPAGGTIDQSIFNLQPDPLGNGTYLIMANGVAGDMSKPFNLSVLPTARSFASTPDVVDIVAFHGAVDAPAVDVSAIGIGDIIMNMDFGAYNSEGYLSLAPDKYYLGIKQAGITNTLVSFAADISGLAGQSATLFASGYLANQMASSFGLFAALEDGTVVELAVENVCRVQVVHDAPVAEFVDVWFNDDTKALEDFRFETATPFITFPIENSISITAPGSTDTTGNFLTIPGNTLAVGETYYVVAAGDNIAEFGVEVFQGARERSETGFGIDLQAFHGSPDAPAVDVRVRNAFSLFENLEPRAYGDAYVNVPEDLYLLDITLPGEEDALFTFLANLNGLDGGAALVFASGYTTRSAEIDSSFKLLAALPDGNVVTLGRFDVAFANVVHAATAAAADSVDVYLDTLKILDNFPYLAATGFVELAANAEIRINLKTSTGPEDGNVLTIPANTLQKDSVHWVVVYGDGSDDFPISVNFIDTARATNSVPGGVDITAFHAIPGVPSVDVRNGANTTFPVIYSDLGYGEFADYILAPAGSYFFRFTPAGNAIPGIATFNTDLFEEDESVLLLATGNVTPEADYNLYVVLPGGGVFPSEPQALVQIIHNSPVEAVNPADIWLTIDGTDVGAIQDVPFRSATAAGYLPTRIGFDVGIAPGNSGSSADAVVSFPVTFEDGKDYTVIAYGDNEAGTPVSLGVQTETRFSAFDGDFDMQVFHGSTDAGTVDILAGGSTVVDDLEYGTFRGYLALGDEGLEISIADPSGSTIVGTYEVPTDEWTNDGYTSGTVFASGYLMPEVDQPGFELWIAFSDGTSELLEVLTSTNELEQLLTGFTVFPNPVTTSATVQYELAERMEMVMRVIANDGRIIEERDLGTLPAGTYTTNIDAFDLPNGTYHLQMTSSKGSITKRIVVVQ